MSWKALEIRVPVPLEDVAEAWGTSEAWKGKGFNRAGGW